MAGEVRVARALSALAADRVIERIWERDHTVWGPHPDGISDRLGWLEAPDWMEPRLPEIRSFAEQAISDGIDHFVLVGMGGSARAAKVIHRTFGSAPGHPVMVPLESTVPFTVRKAMDRIDPARTLVLVSSKSGATMEPMLLYRVLRREMERAIGVERAGRRLVAITDPNSPLADVAAKEGFGTVFLNEPTVGGRFSAMTYFGLVPAALLGADVEALVAGGRRMRNLCGPGIPPDSNPAALLGATIGSMALQGKDKLTLVTSPGVFGYGLWVVQLVAESLGKDGKGVVPVAGEPLVNPHFYGDDRLFVYLRLDGDDNDATDDAMEAVSAKGHPVITLRMADRCALGGEFFRWELAVAVAASVLGINAFDQPDVQRSKDRTRAILGDMADGARPAQPPPRTGERHPAADDARDLVALLRDANPDDYFGILAFLPHEDSIIAALGRMREQVVRRYGLATTLGHGPSYLHSTGQLHKGGRNNGIFLQLTAPHVDDQAIPGRRYTLGDVTDADAMGDLAALKELGRRVVCVGLSGDPAAAIDDLTSALSQR